MLGALIDIPSTVALFVSSLHPLEVTAW